MDINSENVTTLPHEQRFQALATGKVLESLGLDNVAIRNIFHDRETQDMFILSIGKFFIDPGSVKAVGFVDAGSISDVEVPDELYKTNRAIPLVLSSKAYKYMMRAGNYSVISSFDISNLGNANGVPVEPYGSIGDVMIRDILLSVEDKFITSQVPNANTKSKLKILSETKRFLARVGGDEFLIIEENQRESSDENDKTKIDITEIQAELDKDNVQSLLQIEGQTVLQNVKVKSISDTPMPQNGLEANDTFSTRDRLSYLEKFHPAVKVFIEDLRINDADTNETASLKLQLIDLLEDIYYDNLLHTDSLKISEKYNKIVNVYSDRGEFSEVIEELQGKEGEVGSLGFIDVAGIAKQVNEIFGYEAGNDFVKWKFNIIAQAIAEEPSISQVSIWRKGVDILPYFPPDTGKEVINRIYSKIKESLGAEYIVKYDGNEIKSFPVIASLVSAPISLVRESNAGRSDVITKNINIFNDVQNVLDNEISESLKGHIIILQQNPSETEKRSTAKFITDMFNPYSKRGAIKLKSIGLSVNIPEILSTFFSSTTTSIIENQELDYIQYLYKNINKPVVERLNNESSLRRA